MPINQEFRPCWWCGRTAVHRHHAFGGRNRPNSTKYKLIFYLCDECHEHGPDAVHKRPKGPIATAIKEAAQEQFEQLYGDHEMFMSIFHPKGME